MIGPLSVVRGLLFTTTRTKGTNNEQRTTDNSMFDLEKAIASWRRSFRYRRVFFEEDLEELERHVRDHVVGRVGQGWTEKAAFGDAVRGVGDYGAMETEYRKVYWGKLRHKRSQML